MELKRAFIETKVKEYLHSIYVTIPNKFLAVSDILNVFGCFNFYYRTPDYFE